MKIVCDSCGAKYSIADEKVAGKVFKIRCKKCSAVIVVRGDQVATPHEEAPAQPALDAIWHVVIDGDQQGPFVLSQLGDMLGAGTIDWDSYVWREGFDGWLAARDVPEVVEGLTGGPAPTAEPATGGYAPGYGNETLGAGAQESYGSAGLNPFGGDGPAAEVAGAGGGLFGGSNVGADLFAQSDIGASPFDGGAADDVIASTPPGPGPGPAAEDQAMTGQRNENSVLFSLANLQALATGPEGAPPSPAAAPASASAGQASGEGSGLIDIRALASTTGTLGSPSSSPPARGKDNVDNLLSIGTGSAFGSSLGAPVLAPVQEEKSNRMVILGAAAVVGISVLAAAAVVAVVALRDPPEVAANQPAAIAPPPGTPAALTGQASAAPGDLGTAAPAAEETALNAEERRRLTTDHARRSDATERSRERERRARRSDRNPTAPTRSAEPTASPAMQEAPPPSMTSARRGNDIDSLLEAALGGGSMMSSRMAGRTPAMAAGGGGNLPDTPPRDAVARALRSVSGAVRSCGAGQHGVANTTVVIAGSTGRVQSARVAGAFAGTPVGSCVARAVRRARFPRFSRSSFSVTFPYSL